MLRAREQLPIRDEGRALIARVPERVRPLAGHVEPRSEEGIEQLLRFVPSADGIACSVQVAPVAEHRVDVLLDGWLVLEADGRGTHALQQAFTRDAMRYGAFMRDGRIVLRFACSTIVYEIELVLETIRSVMAQHAPVR